MSVEASGKRIELVCPKCEQLQLEPAMVISTLCRSCGFHMNVRDGKPVLRPQQATKLASPGKPPVQHPSTGNTETPAKPLKREGVGFFRKMFQGEPEKRPVDCLHCGKVFEVVRDAQSSQCPKCGGYISLRDYEVDTDWRRRIQTRGDVTILKGGSIIGVNVQCHDLTVFGKLAAPVECSGALRIKSHGRIMGNVTCRELRVERGAEVEFQGEVHAESAYIDGDVRAQLTCTGTITLEKKAHLQGLARAGALVVKAGAKHTGMMEVVSPAADASKSV
jgi:cytoskeletal protein CcmA (bactofilin family)/Zn finger protein HypA/HybF involved in hydrogenase expression